MAIYFEDLQQRLAAVIRRRLQSGELTERSLARLAGISQSHVHNVLKGVRNLSPALADVIMRRLNLSVSDLLTREDLDRPRDLPEPRLARRPGRPPGPGGRYPAN